MRPCRARGPAPTRARSDHRPATPPAARRAASPATPPPAACVPISRAARARSRSAGRSRADGRAGGGGRLRAAHPSSRRIAASLRHASRSSTSMPAAKRARSDCNARSSTAAGCDRGRTVPTRRMRAVRPVPERRLGNRAHRGGHVAETFMIRFQSSIYTNLLSATLRLRQANNKRSTTQCQPKIARRGRYE